MVRRSKAERERRNLEATAYHEAGHAVVALELRRAIRRVSIVPKEDSLGRVLKTHPPSTFQLDCLIDRRTSNWIEREVLIGLAGLVAEGTLRGRNNHIGASSDYRRIVDLASHEFGFDEVLTKWALR